MGQDLIVNIAGSTYNIKVGEQEEEYDLKLSLDESWSFKPLIASTITISLDGFTPVSVEGDADFLMTFAVGDWQYFSFFIHLDDVNIKSRIFPMLNTSAITQPVSQWMASNAIHTRWDRISNNGSWLIVRDWKDKAVWPLRFVMTNDPMNDISYFRFYHTPSMELATSWTFNHAFTASKGMDMYIMGDSTNERFNVSAMNMQFSHEVTTAAPTVSTLSPSTSPSRAPSGSVCSHVDCKAKGTYSVHTVYKQIKNRIDIVSECYSDGAANSDSFALSDDIDAVIIANTHSLFVADHFNAEHFDADDIMADDERSGL